MSHLEERIKKEEDAKSKTCSCIGCENIATHTWSGYPTCDDCGSPNRTNLGFPRIISGNF